MTTVNSNKLIPTGKLGPLKVGLAAKVAQAAKQGELATDLFDYTKYPNRIVLCVDDSGSMCSEMVSVNQYTSRMDVCKKACEEFLNVCDSRDTALGLYTISTGKAFSLPIAYPMLLTEIRQLHDSGDTPTTATLDKIIQHEKVSRVVLISDGESGALAWQDFDSKGDKFQPQTQAVLDKYKEIKAPIDTVFIGSPGDETSSGYKEMKLIAEYTGGLFMFFKEGESFRTKFKYLAPAFRGMLVSGEIKL